MIPKIIHYCWLSGDPFPSDLQRYMETWRQKLPGYTFMLWDTQRFPLEKSLWVKQAFECKKYAFAADYIRLYALYHYGGIYLDTDVEVVNRYDPLLSLRMMVGLDHNEHDIEAATWGSEKGNPALKVLLDKYDTLQFLRKDGEMNLFVMPAFVSKIWNEAGYSLVPVSTQKEAQEVEKDPHKIPVFPRTWFCPQNFYDFHVLKSQNTFSIHHYKGSWLPEDVQRERNILRRLGPYLPRVWRRIQRYWYRWFPPKK